MQNKIKPSVVCKNAGLKSLVELSKITGESQQTLINWHKNKPRLFAVVVAGARMTQIVHTSVEKRIVDGTGEHKPVGLMQV